MGWLGLAIGVLVVLGMTGFGLNGLVESVAHGDSPGPALLVLTIPLLVAGALVASIATLPMGRRRARGGVTALVTIVAATLIGVGLYASVAANVASQRPAPAITAALAPACAQRAVADAGTVASGGNHLVVLDQAGHETDWTGYPPLAWRPPTVADAELVACVGPEQQPVIDTCSYVNGSDITRYADERDVTVVEAGTGRLLASFTLRDEARECHSTEKKDLTELRGDLQWPALQARLASLVTTGVDASAADGGDGGGPTPKPAASASAGRTPSPTRTATPRATPVPSARPSASATVTSVELRKALSAGLVSAKGAGDGLQRLDLTLTSTSASPLLVNVAVGTMLDPSAKATQSMVVLTPQSVELAPKERRTVTLEVACAEMHDGQPGSSDAFTVRSTQATSAVMKLLRAPSFPAATFRVQQFAIWTLIENPARSGYQALGSTFSVYGTGPSDTELSQIAALVKAAGLDPTDYRALR